MNSLFILTDTRIHAQDYVPGEREAQKRSRVRIRFALQPGHPSSPHGTNEKMARKKFIPDTNLRKKKVHFLLIKKQKSSDIRRKNNTNQKTF